MLTRRHFLAAGSGIALLGTAQPLCAGRLAFPQVRPELLTRARAAMESKRRFIEDRRTMVVVDFSHPSSNERFHIVDMASGWVTSYHVAHGRGSDPEHTGLLRRFSNAPGSEASSAGAYVLREAYRGKHGRAVRLEGLDPTNSNARARGIVIHAAAYAEPEALARFGKLGRSEGCFAVSQLTMSGLLEQLSPGCLLYCGKA